MERQEKRRGGKKIWIERKGWVRREDIYRLRRGEKDSKWKEEEEEEEEFYYVVVYICVFKSRRRREREEEEGVVRRNDEKDEDNEVERGRWMERK